MSNLIHKAEDKVKGMMHHNKTEGNSQGGGTGFRQGNVDVADTGDYDAADHFHTAHTKENTHHAGTENLGAGPANPLGMKGGGVNTGATTDYGSTLVGDKTTGGAAYGATGDPYGSGGAGVVDSQGGGLGGAGGGAGPAQESHFGAGRA